MENFLGLSFPRLDEADQLFNVVKLVIIADDPLAVINNAGLFVAFEAIQKSGLSISLGKQRKAVGFSFGKQTFLAKRIAIEAMRVVFFKRAAAVFAPVLIRAISRVAAAAGLVFAAKAAGQSASSQSKLPFHI